MSLLLLLPGVVIEAYKDVRKCLSDVEINGTRVSAAHARITYYARGLFRLTGVQYSSFFFFLSL